MMGFGLMGAGSAVKGLVSGYQQGRKFAQDEERFEMEKEKFGLEKEAFGQRGRLTEEQIRGVRAANVSAERANRVNEEEDEDIRSSMDIVKSVFGPRPAPSSGSSAVAGPDQPTAAVGVEGAPVRQGGIAPPPGAVGAAPSRTTPSLNDLQEMYSKLNSVGLRRILRTQGPAAAVQQALEMGKRFSDAKSDAAVQALSAFDGSNADQVVAMLGQAGIQMPEGTRFERRQVEPIPGSGYKVDDVVAISPDGKATKSMLQIMRSRMSPAEIMRQDTEVGRAVAEIAQRKTAEDNLQAFRTLELDIKEKSANDQANYYMKMLEARTKELGFQSDARRDANEAQAELRRSQASRNALSEVMQLAGVSRETSAKDMEMLSDTERARVQGGLARAFTAHTIWSMNPPGTISPAEALEIGRRVALDPKAVKVDRGQAVIEFAGKSVFVPAPVTAPAPAPAPTSQSAAAPAPRPGIAPPRNQLPPQAEQAGAAVDAARAKVAAATTTLQRFGLRQQQQDPNGFAAARQALDAARSELSQAESAYQGALPAGLSQAFSR